MLLSLSLLLTLAEARGLEAAGVSVSLALDSLKWFLLGRLSGEEEEEGKAFRSHSIPDALST